MWRDFFYFTKKERQGIVLLFIFFGGIIVGKYLFASPVPEPLKEQELPEPIAIRIQDSISAEAAGKMNPQEISATGRKQTYTPEKRTYYVHEKDTLRKPLPSIHYPKIEKLTAGQTVELNLADTNALKKIPGIGSTYARRIINYRDQLGGFYRKEQLQEVYGMYEELYERISPFIQIDSLAIQQINIHTVSLEQLKAHPYIDFYQAKVIIELRKKKKSISDMDELKLLDEFTEKDRARMEPYLLFSDN